MNFILNSSKQIKGIALAIGILVFLILFLFEPFGDIEHGFKIIGLVRILSYAVLASVTFLVSEQFVRPLILRTFPILKNKFFPIIWYLLELLLVTLAIFLCRSYWVGFENVTLSSFYLVLYRVFSIALIPLVLLFIFVYKTSDTDGVKQLLFKSNDKNPDYLKLEASKVLYLLSEDNYTTIYFLNKENNVQQKLLRGSLSYFEDQILEPLVRIHRSHIVNLEAIKDVEYNSQGGMVTLSHTSEKFRISRKYIPVFREQWEALNKASYLSH